LADKMCWNPKSHSTTPLGLTTTGSCTNYSSEPRTKKKPPLEPEIVSTCHGDVDSNDWRRSSLSRVHSSLHFFVQFFVHSSLKTFICIKHAFLTVYQARLNTLLIYIHVIDANIVSYF